MTTKLLVQTNSHSAKVSEVLQDPKIKVSEEMQIIIIDDNSLPLASSLLGYAQSDPCPLREDPGAGEEK